jgi:Uma2 family endonuclease
MRARTRVASFELAVQLRPPSTGVPRGHPGCRHRPGVRAAGRPGFSRRPDLVVVQRSARRRVRDTGGLIRAAEVVVVIEIVSPGSRRTDHVVKRSEYADAGIPHYWIVDLDRPVSLLDCHLAGDFGYQDAGGTAGNLVTSQPFPVRVELHRLR